MPQQVPMFADAPEPLLKEVESALKELTFTANSCILKKGDLGRCMYIIAEGKVNVLEEDDR